MHKHHHLGKKREKAHIQGILDEGKERNCHLGPVSDFSFSEEERIGVCGLELLVYR